MAGQNGDLPTQKEVAAKRSPKSDEMAGRQKVAKRSPKHILNDWESVTYEKSPKGRQKVAKTIHFLAAKINEMAGQNGDLPTQKEVAAKTNKSLRTIQRYWSRVVDK